MKSKTPFKVILLALIKFGHLGATDIRGTTGGTTFSKNRGGAYVRRRVVGTNPQTPAQTSVRNEFGTLSQAWRTISQVRRDTWINATIQFPRLNKLGDTFHLSGLNLFKSLNQNLFDAGLGRINVAPAPVGTSNVSSLSFVPLSAGTMIVTFSATPTPANNYTLVYASPQVSPGINFLKNRMRIIEVLAPATATGVDVYAAYLAKFGDVIVGQRMNLGFVAVNGVTGEKSPMITATAIGA